MITTQEIREALVPRLMELSRARCKVFIEIDNLMYQVSLNRGIPIAKFCLDGTGPELNAEFFRNMFDEEGYGVDITLEDIMAVLSIDINVWNYKEKATALTTKA